ncbi:MAG TPA: molybdopterin-synthase adenylyltransferase MoeB [Anaerolineae bacterium]|nr:molybdopterin-synthase adenylyltransferase MoeB [Anaerolineae bacterium]
MAVQLSHQEIRRYSRHLIMPEVGLEGQRKLKEAKVLLVGAGGLGAPMAMYLAAAGVGHIGIMDFDVVDESNLQRQIIHGTATLGQKKLESAKNRMLDINPFIDVTTYEEPLSSANALEIFKDYDIIADGTDNFQTRYLVNDACVLLGKPNVYGSIFRFEGQASVFYAKEGPCYRCLYPEPPPPGLVPSCAEGGVFGVLPGVVGTIQATEVIKLIIGQGDPLIGRLLLYDALEMSFTTLKLRKNPECVICSDHPTVTQLIDYDQFCGVLPHEVDAQGLEITVKELKARLDQDGKDLILIDVREPHELEISRIDRAQLIPKNDLPDRLKELDSTKDYVTICKTGVRSLDSAKLMKAAGFRVKSVRGGINAWAREIDPSLPTY